VKNISTSNYITNVLIEQTPLGNFGNGLVDPASTNYLMSLNCIGNGCQTSVLLTPAWRTLYNFEGFTSQGTVVFGSQYVKQPLTTMGPSNFH